MTAVLPETVPIPANSDELAEFMGDPGRYKPILASPETLRDFIDAYAQKVQGEGTELHRAVAAETQRQLAAYLKEKDLGGDNEDRIRRLNLDPQASGGRGGRSMLTSYGQGAAYNRHAPGAKIDGKFATATEYFRAIWHLDESPEAVARRAEIRNAASSVVPSDGGFLVPERLRSQLLEVADRKSTRL